MIKKNPDTKAGLEKAIDALLSEMSEEKPDTEKYSQMADQLSKLYKLKEVDSKIRISPDTLLTVFGTFIGIVWITRYERENVVTSKALQFIQTLRP